MLAPESLELLTDALRPPAGYTVDLAVATSYSLDLTALLLAPMTFALQNSDSNDVEDDPLAVLANARRYAERLTLFCQAGAIHEPRKFSPLLQFIESSIHEVTPPAASRGLFHPKVWVIRFAAAGNAGKLHRVLVLSRNLTFDDCWDTVLRLDEREEARAGSAPDTEPLVTFLCALPRLAIRPMTPARQAQINDLSRSVGRASFDVPDGCAELTFVPLGFGDKGRPFPSGNDRALLISPFLDRAAVRRVMSESAAARILSRPEAMDRIGPDALPPHAEGWTLQRAAEVQPASETAVRGRAAGVRDGLHAKTFVFETADRATLVTGSANLTTAAFDRNVEFVVVLRGPAVTCGIDATWEGTSESPGLSRLCERYQAVAQTAADAQREALEREIAEFHVALALGGPRLNVVGRADDHVDLEWSLPASPDRETRMFGRPR